jgi:Glyoxalase-like domain
MKGINHLVIAGRDLEAMRRAYQGLGFTVTPRGEHPFGTENSIIQLRGTYLELLGVAAPHDVPEHRENHFSFAAFNRDYLSRHEGFSMLVFDTSDARADLNRWRAAGLKTYEPYDFSRTARMPDGTEVRVGFSLAFASHPSAPWLGMFACQHHRPEYYEQAEFLKHSNGALSVRDVWVVGEATQGLADFISAITGASAVRCSAGRTVFQTQTGAIVLARENAFTAEFGVPPPHQEDGPHLAGLTIACCGLERLRGYGLQEIDGRQVVAPTRNFGTAIAFVA